MFAALKRAHSWETALAALSRPAADLAGRPAAAAATAAASSLPANGPSLSDFIAQAHSSRNPLSSALPSLDSSPAAAAAAGRRVHIETYGCQMNVNDSEVVHSVLREAGFSAAPSPDTADVVLINTCAIRDNAEAKIWQRLGYFKNMKASRKATAKKAAKNGENGVQSTSPAAGPVVGVLGCMAERLKHRLLESDRLVDLVAGPDAYRDLPRLISIVDGGASAAAVPGSNSSSPTSPRRSAASSESAAINVQLSADETYADVVPVRPAGATSAFLSIMRGCNNLCAFCVVPFTRGRERSRPLASIVDEVKMLSEQGVREVTLLGQNVNSYADFSAAPPETLSRRRPTASDTSDPDAAFQAHYAAGFRSVYRPRRDGAASFAQLLDAVAAVDPEMRIRFTSPHPKDFSNDVLAVIASRPNVCKQLHMPAQSGSTTVLERMRRGYTREAYDALVSHVRDFLPGVALSTDMIAGFCGETEEEHVTSVELLRQVRYEQAFLFAYSLREQTHAARHLEDNVPAEVKSRRLMKLIETFREGLRVGAAEEVGRRHLVLVEGPSRRSPAALTGRTDTFKRVVFPDVAVPDNYVGTTFEPNSTHAAAPLVRLQPGDYVAVQVASGGGGGSLRAVPMARTSIREFVGVHGSAVPLGKYDPLPGAWSDGCEEEGDEEEAASPAS